jgi:glutamate--cysteine ligase
MSTVNPTDKDDPGLPLGGVAELVGTFQSAEKPPAAFRVGTEHEKFGFLRVPGAASQPPLPFDGPRGIEAILNAIQLDPEEKVAWVPATDRGRTIALFQGAASITLEPGGQLELSGAPLHTIHETCVEVGSHLKLLRRACLPRGVGFIGMGFHPTATWDEIPMVPKARYEIMARYMPKVGARGLDMMKRTATVQANYDWSSEADMVASTRTALAVSPLVAALFANSPFYEGKVSGAVSERQRVWADTDPDRAGFPQVMLDENLSYERYVDWVLSVPMYFVRRDGLHHDVAGASFRTFMREGLVIDGTRVHATLRDWNDHLTTIFPEVRLKRILEVRSADCGPWSRVCALPALYKGLLYDAEARAAAWALMDTPTGAELTALRADVAVSGFRALFRGRTVLALSEELLDIAKAGLDRLNCTNARGETESRFLVPLEETVSSGMTFAERLVALFEGPWGGSMAPLWETLEFWPDQNGDDFDGGAPAVSK